ncbi:MAG TPA: hypothetical protein VFJ25_07505 [Casimicrobiaceae bacterium]|jgi:hypothetical protein|nr:hypothetical protein [Casimicrobiaceae bacterium]
MRTPTYESTPPRLALALAAFVLASASLATLVWIPAITDDGSTTAAVATPSTRPPTAQARPGVLDARSATNDAHPAKRGT